MKAHYRGIINSTSRNLTIDQITKKLEKMDIYIFDAEKQIRQSIHIIRKNIKKRYGVDIGNEIIESPENGGYQIGSKVCLIFDF